MIITIKQAEDLIYQSYLNARTRLPEADDSVTRRPELTRQLLDILGSPDKAIKSIIVTGSKGKGSTARMIAAILSHHGLKVGLFTSPHLIHFNERIRVDGYPITEEDFITMMNRVARPLTEIQNKLTGHHYVGPVGIALAAATLYFKEKKTDINVFECGRGGTFDDVNVIDNEWAVITPIMKEHLGPLGRTLDDIIAHKIGIVKDMTKVVLVQRQPPEIVEAIKKKLSDSKRKHFFGANHFYPAHVQMNKNGLTFQIITDRFQYDNIYLPLLGRFQADNAALAVKTCETILENKLQPTIVTDSFKSLFWSGRMEIVQEKPMILIDGAINEESALFTKDTVDMLNPGKVVSVIAVPEDKDYRGVIKVCSEFSDQIVITKPDSSHKQFPDDAYPFACGLHRDVYHFHLLSTFIKEMDQFQFDLLLFIGTQTFIGNVKKLLQSITIETG